MKQVVVLSGKGGTGKTCVAAALADLAARSGFEGRLVLADVDVDAANLSFVARPRAVEAEEFRGGRAAVIDHDACTACARCEEVCRFDSIRFDGGRYEIDAAACEGCAACVHQCPAECITMHDRVAGTVYRSGSRYGWFHFAELFPGQENSGKLVTSVKQHARLQAVENGAGLMLADGPPGIGCPVISAASGADLALIVAEPSISGVHDMQRVVGTVAHFGVRAIVCINKADIYPDGTSSIEDFCRENGIEVAGTVPFDDAVPRAMVLGEPVTSLAPESAASRGIVELWTRLLSFIGEQG